MEEDLFKAAGLDLTNETPRGRKKRKTTREKKKGPTPYSDDESSYGGHNLRQVVGSRARDGEPVTYRPRSKLATESAQQTLESIMDATTPKKATTTKTADSDKSSSEESDDSNDSEESDDDDDDNNGNDDEGIEDEDYNKKPPAQPVAFTTTPPTPQKQTSSTAPTAHTPQPFPFTTVREDSELGRAAAAIFTAPGYSLKTDLKWQSAVAGDATKIKAFRQEVTQQVEVVPFAFMRPSSPFIQILHSVATYAVRGGDSELHGKDFGFVGDRTHLRVPSAVVVDESMWKWLAKQLGLDVPPIQEFYKNPANAKRLYHDTASGGSDTNVPRMAYLPPPFLAFCVEQQRTPFELHEFITKWTTQPNSEVAATDCTTLMDWCLVATQTSKAAAPTTSILAIPLQTAPADDETFVRWLYKIDRTKADSQQPQPAPQTQVAQQAAVMQPPAGPPPVDVWTQMAKSISTSFASAAAAMKPPPADDPDTSYELGGRLYDKFQMAMVKGFAHVHDIADVPSIWALFQYTKHLETHKDNLRRKMIKWATTTDKKEREEQVQIDRSFFLPDSTMKEILSLQFNPGGIVPDPEEADSGLSILICRSRTTAARAAIKKFEKAKEQSKRNRSMAEAELELSTPAYDLGALPDDYNELHRCIGTYCALLFALFGKRCSFYKQCYLLWKTMNSDLVFEQRQKFFTVLFCRQIVWAVIAESRVFFSQRMSVDDFKGIHPDDIQYPRSQLLSVITNVRDGIPIIRGSFPAAWYPPGTTSLTQPDSGTVSNRVPSIVAPVQSVAPSPGGATPTVVSGLTTGSTRAPRPPITIRATNIHPKIKAAMEAYIQKHKAVYLTAMLNHANITMDDLPKPSLDHDIGGGVCYNFILGRCAVDQCQHEHVNATDITDEFATDLLAKLRPSITEFVTNGLPAGTKRRRPRGGRRRRE